MTRGEVYALRPPRDRRGHEQRGERFAVVVQASELGELSTTIVAPTSTGAKHASFRPRIEVRGRKTLALTDQLRAVDAGRLGTLVDRLDAGELRRIDDALALVLGLPRLGW